MIKNFFKKRDDADRWMDAMVQKTKKCRKCLNGQPCKRHTTHIKQGLNHHREIIVSSGLVDNDTIDSYGEW